MSAKKRVRAYRVMHARAAIAEFNGVKIIANGAHVRQRAFAALATLKPVVSVVSSYARLSASGANAVTQIWLGESAEIVAGSGVCPMATGQTSAQLAPMNHAVRTV